MTIQHTVNKLLTDGVARLTQASETPRLDAELLLAHALKVSRAWLITHAEAAAPASEYPQLVARRVAGEPLAYIVGIKDFWTHSLMVTPAVLVPRPETELVVERALALVSTPTARVVDLGTGSGAIALALASERPSWHITATDASPEALAVARANASKLQLTRIELLLGNWFEPVAARRFDLVVSNPPYIAKSDPALAQPALRHEPAMALSPGEDGMSALRAIVHGAAHHLDSGGWLLLEHGATQAQDLALALVSRGFTHVRSHRDLAGHERVTEARWP